MNKIQELQREKRQMVAADPIYDEEVQSIFKTNNYAKFKTISGNRIMNELHQKRLEGSMKEENLNSPINVNELFEIIDGQHRFYSWMSLGLPVQYYISEGYRLPQVQRLNINSTNWKMEDYAEGYSDLGNMNYVKYTEYKKKHKFGHVELRGMLSGDFGKHTGDIFKKGLFEVENEDEYLEIVDRFNQIEPYYLNNKNRSFVQSMLALFRNPNFNFERFMKKLAIQQGKLVDCTTKKGYLTIIEDIYNFRSTNLVYLKKSR